MSKPTIKALLALLVCTILYHWRTVLTHEYSLLAGWEGLSLNHALLQFWIQTIRAGEFPLWNPFALNGNPFGGPMQTAAFYPLHLLLVAFPFNHRGTLSPQLVYEWTVLTRFLGGCFMFALVRELGLRRLAAVIAGLCFSIGGFATAGWMFMLQTVIWLPLIFLCLLRALRAEKPKRAALYAALGGLSLGLATLAGGLHHVIMEALVVVSAVAFAALDPSLRQKGPVERAWIRPAMVVAVVAGVAFCAGAVQLLTSAEYSHHSLRFFSSELALPPSERIPSTYPDSGLWPHALWGVLLTYGFGGHFGTGEVTGYYVGVFPLLAAVIGVWKRWNVPWVRYLAGLFVLVFLYALGQFCAFYGIVRTLVPYLWMAREASRFMYLAGFALAVLAAFGLDALLEGPADEPAWRPLTRVLTWVVIACAVAQAIPAVYEHPGINPWISLSMVFIAASYGLYRFLIRGRSGASVRFAIMGLVLVDLTSFNWAPVDRRAAEKAGADALERTLSTRNAVDFLKSRPGRFRVLTPGSDPPLIGDLFQVRMIDGGPTAGLLLNYLDIRYHPDLLSARYTLAPASSSQPGEIYHDSKWKVYENPKAFPAAWVVHQTTVERSHQRLLEKLNLPGVDLHRQAFLEAPLGAVLEPAVEGKAEDVKFGACGRNRLELTVHAESRGLLVLSEMFYPGWYATVNGNAAPIYEVDGALRGVVVPRGASRIVMWYSPWSFKLGALLSATAFAGVFLAVFLTWRGDRRAHEVSASR